jgi:uncharacterized protein (TIGR01777 family)
MDIFITGGSGFVGKTLSRALMDAGHSVTVLSRSARSAQSLPHGVGHTLGDPSQPGPWQEEAAHYQGFINLAGASIFGRWDQKYKNLLRSSRIETTKNLVQAMARRESNEPAVLVSASAVGYYGFCGDEELSESSPPGDDFLAKLCADWEAEALKAQDIGARVALTRFGIVLGSGGGALGQMLPMFKKGLGGRLGSGKQWFSWIHQADLVRAILHCLEHKDLTGPVNCAAPQPVTNRELTKTLAKVLGKPAFLPAPSLAVKFMLGEFGSVLLEGQRVLGREIVVVMGVGFVGPSWPVWWPTRGHPGVPKFVIGMQRPSARGLLEDPYLNRGEAPVEAEDPEVAP